MCQKALKFSIFQWTFAEKALFGNWKADRTKLDKPFDQCQKETTVFCFLFPGKKWLKSFSWYCEVIYDSICQKLLLNVQKILFFQLFRETLQKGFPRTRLFQSMEDEKNNFGLQLIKIVIYWSLYKLNFSFFI